MAPRRIGLLASALAALALPSSASASHEFYVAPGRDLPVQVDPGRFLHLAARSGERTLFPGGGSPDYRGKTSRKPLSLDGRNVVGFTPRVPAHAAGETDAWSLRHCRRHRHRGGRIHRHCRRIVVEVDIGLNPSLPWNDGPSHPGPEEFDLQTTLLHEFGHFVGADDIDSYCENSPMHHEIWPGEWWWGYDDWYRPGCPNAPAASLARSSRHPSAAGSSASARPFVLVERDVSGRILEPVKGGR